MPAPKHNVGKQVTVDGKPGIVVAIIDRGEDGEPSYKVQQGRKTVDVAEDQIVSEEPEVETTEETAGDAGAEAEAGETAEADREASGTVAGVRDAAGPDDSNPEPGN